MFLKNSFDVSVIPHTFKITNLSNLIKGSKVNIEFDPLARYISDRIMQNSLINNLSK